MIPKGSTCWVCGPDNKAGLGVSFEPEGTNGSRAVYVARAEHGGWPGILHGGIALTLMDEALGWSLYFHGEAGLTARFDARLRQQIRVGSRVVVRAWTLERRRQFIKARAEVRLDTDTGAILAEADATMFLIQEDTLPTFQ